MASGPWWLGISFSGTRVFIMPLRWLSQGSVARRSRVPLAFFKSPAFLSAVSVLTMEVVLQETTLVASLPMAVS